MAVDGSSSSRLDGQWGKMRHTTAQRLYTDKSTTESTWWIVRNVINSLNANDHINKIRFLCSLMIQLKSKHTVKFPLDTTNCNFLILYGTASYKSLTIEKAPLRVFEGQVHLSKNVSNQIHEQTFPD